MQSLILSKVKHINTRRVLSTHKRVANDLLDESVTRSFSHELDDLSSYAHTYLSDIKYNSYHPQQLLQTSFQLQK